MRPILRSLPRPFKWLLSWLVALVILFEEWGWEPLMRLAGALARLPPVAWLERRIELLPPRAALTVFLAPTLLLLPIKLLALWIIGQGDALFGLLVIVAAKIAGTALVARLFMLTRPQLMQVAWFANLHERWSAFKEGVIAMVRASATWRLARAMKAWARRVLRGSGRT
jgi:hypothetical protein